MSNPWLHLLLIFSAGALQESKQSGISPYARIIYEHSTAGSPAVWRVQTSVRTFVHPENGRVVTLISTQHIARAEYFSTIQSILGNCDAVIGEGWKDLKETEIHPDLVWIKRLREASARILGLSQQEAWESRAGIEITRIDIDKPRMKAILSTVESILPQEQKNFILRLEAFDAKTSGGQELDAMRSDLMRFWMTDVRNHEQISAASPLEPLNRERDKAMAAGIKSFLTSKAAKNVALVYGAGHAECLEKAVTGDLGFKLVATTWIDSLDLPESKVTPQGKKTEGR